MCVGTHEARSGIWSYWDLGMLMLGAMIQTLGVVVVHQAFLTTEISLQP